MLNDGLLVGILIAIIGQSALIWKALGSVQTGLKGVKDEQQKVALALIETNKKSCPFPACPVFNRAISEAAPDRSMPDHQ